MVRLLVALIRISLLLVAGSALLALGVAVILVPERPSAPVFSSRWQSVNRVLPPGHEGPTGFYLVDRETGRCELKPLPAGKQWGLLGVSPWHDEEGEPELLGACHSFAIEPDGTSFWGLARLRMLDGAEIGRVRLDILPTSPPCWLPDRPGEILFAAGDGQLYRQSLSTAPDDPAGRDGSSPDIPKVPGPRPVVWKCPAPGNGPVYLADPFWPSDPRLDHLLFVTLSYLARPEDTFLTGSPQVWWLRMSLDGAAIEAAGPLFSPEPGRGDHHPRYPRFPQVAVDGEGTIRLAYLTRAAGQGSADLTTIPLELDPVTGRPRPRPGQAPRLLARGCATVPPVFTADGTRVFGISQGTGVIGGYLIRDDAISSDILAVASDY
jgi:hypothetical protein